MKQIIAIMLLGLSAGCCLSPTHWAIQGLAPPEVLERLNRPIEIGERIWVCNRRHLVVSPKTERRVSPRGVISLPMLGPVHIAGQQRKDAERMIEKLYVDGGFYRKVDIAIIRDEESSNQASEDIGAGAPNPQR